MAKKEKNLLKDLSAEILNEKNTAALAKTSGASDKQVKGILSAALPLLLQSMTTNASSQSGSQSLATALAAHAQTQGSVSQQLQNADTEDGAKIIEHLLGGNTSAVQSTLAQNSGLSSAQVSTILASLAPALMSSVGKETVQVQQAAQNSAPYLSGMLLSLITGKPSTSAPSAPASSGLDLGGILNFAMKDRDGDGQSDVLSILGKLMSGK